MITSIITSLTAALFFAAPAQGAIGRLDSGHRAIVDAAARAGITVTVDPKLCQELFADGFYDDKRLAICTRGKGWSPNNLDTLRHEAQHLVQDCLVDGKANYRFPGNKTLVDSPVAFAASVGMTENEVARIFVGYASMDLEESEILMEVEAFAVAKGISAQAIADAIDASCRK